MTYLSILIPTLYERKNFFDRCVSQLKWQINQLADPSEVEILSCIDNGEVSTGLKSNWLMDNAKGVAIARVDDDDLVSDVYVKKGLEFAKSGKDTASLIGLYFLNGVYDRPFLHSLKYEKWWQDQKYYYRCTNHLNFVRKDLVKHIRYQDKVVGEDGNWSMDVKAARVLKTEFEINETLYLYYARSK